MSIVKLRKKVRKQIKLRLFGKTYEMGSFMGIVFWIIVIIFLAGTYYMYGPGGDTGGPEQQATGRKVTKLVATVDGRPIARMQYEGRLYYAERMQQQSDVTRMRYLKSDVLNSLIDLQLKTAAARAEGIKVSGAEISAKKDEFVDQMIETQYSDQALLHKVLKQRNISLDELKRELRSSDRMPNDSAMREQITFEKLQEGIEGQVQVSEAEVKDSYREVRARHILVSADKILEEAQAEADAAAATDGEGGETEAPAAPVMTEEQAKQKAREMAIDLKKQIDEGADFAALATERSHDPGSAMNGGDLDWFTRDRMIKEFSDVAFTLKPGEVSEPVESSFGIHIIKVEETREQLPEDFEENKAQYTEEVTSKLKSQAWASYEEDLRKAADIEIIDPELKAYELLNEDPTGAASAAAELLAAAMEADPDSTSARYELAMLMDRGGQRDPAIEIMMELAESNQAAQSPQIRLQLGKMLKEADRNEEAVDHLKSASDWAQGFDYQNYFVHMELQRLFEEMGVAEESTKEQQWIDDFSEQMQQNNAMGSPGVIN